MNPKHYYHTPIKPVSTRVSCPVCHEAVYSRAGIHPQCAVIQSDPPRQRGKKNEDATLLDPAIVATAAPGAVVGDEAPIIELTKTAGRSILPPVSHGWRTRR
jgi:hypothetical protein